MEEADKKTSEEAMAWVKANKKEILSKFMTYPSVAKPVSIFMAGSPGAGKTEFSKHLIANILHAPSYIARIDPDEIRIGLPCYVPGRAELFQPAVSVAVEKIHDYVTGRSVSSLLDGTLSDLEKARSNIQRSINKGRSVIIQYIYQPPEIAWKFTLAREQVEGRNIPKEVFIDQFFAAHRNVDILKKEFGSSVRIDFIERDISKNTYNTYLNIPDIDKYIKKRYTRETLLKNL